MSQDLDIFSEAVSLEVNTEAQTETPVEKVEEVAPAEQQPPKQEETIETLETLSEKTDDVVPLKKYMAEKNAKREAEQKAKTLEAELAKLRENPSKSSQELNLDVKTLSEKHGIDEEVLSDILSMSHKMTKEQVRQELEQEINPKLAEFEQIKKEKVQQEFEQKFNSLIDKSLTEMPEYANLVDKEDLKQWVKSGQYSKLTLPQLIEQKYSKFVVGKKTIESSHASKQVEMPDTSKPLSDEEYLKLDTNPELREKWAGSLLERAKRMM